MKLRQNISSNCWYRHKTLIFFPLISPFKFLQSIKSILHHLGIFGKMPVLTCIKFEFYTKNYPGRHCVSIPEEKKWKDVFLETGVFLECVELDSIFGIFFIGGYLDLLSILPRIFSMFRFFPILILMIALVYFICRATVWVYESLCVCRYL